MSYVVHFTNQGIVVFDSMALINNSNANAVFQATKNTLDNTAPIVEGALDVTTFADFLRDFSAKDMNAATRDFAASTLGILGGMAALPLGPTAALIFDNAFSEAYKKAHDTAFQWSQNRDWSPLFDLIDRLFDPSENSNELTPSELQELNELMRSTFPLHSELDKYGMFDIADTTNMCFREAQNWQPPRDPLVLDLDGDGIEAVGIDTGNPVLFDHDADGIKTATGWIGSDDGILVLDRNGNGLIDTGRELFGDNTLLQNGARAGQTAANGFEAIADLDANADGHINSSDAVYSQLRVWRDANQDGISQASELQTLTQTGIASIQVTGQATTIDLGQGNTQPFTGSFTRADGSTGSSAVAEVTGSLLLASNNFYIDVDISGKPCNSISWQAPAEQVLPEDSFDFQAYWSTIINPVALGA